MNILRKSSGRNCFDDKPVLLISFMSLLLAAAFLLAVFFGSTDISIPGALNAASQGDYSDPSFRILIYLRLPRAFACILAGAALAVSGVIIQAVLNNAMASPNIIGVNSGAGLMVSIVVAVFPSMTEYLPLAAFAGALGACLLIYFISTSTNSSRMTITLVGITVSSILSAGINAVKTVFPESMYNSNTFMVGGFSGISFGDISIAWKLIVAGIVISVLMGKDVDILSLGEESAMSLGMNVKAERFALLCIASVLAGSAVSFAGLLGFVGLLGAHISRRLCGESHRILIPVSALTGAILVTFCDMLGRVLFAPYEIPVGIILSFVGGPFFIFLILTQRKTRVYD